MEWVIAGIFVIGYYVILVAREWAHVHAGYALDANKPKALKPSKPLYETWNRKTQEGPGWKSLIYSKPPSDRCGHDDREQVMQALTQALGEGYITDEEHTERMKSVDSAKYIRHLEHALRELPNRKTSLTRS